MTKFISQKFTSWKIWGALLLILVILEVAGLAGLVKGLGGMVIVPAQDLSSQLVQVFLRAKIGVEALPKSVQKIQDLELRLAESSVALGELDHLRKENQELRSLLESVEAGAGGGSGGREKNGEGSRFITAPVVILARPSLAVGSKQGVVTGSLVFSRGVLLGKVSQVFLDYSRVELLSEKDTRPILVQTESGVQGIIQGDGRRVLLTEVASDAQLQVGERVVTVGQSDFIADLFVGRITQVKNDPVVATQTAILEQYTSFYEVPVVEVK